MKLTIDIEVQSFQDHFLVNGGDFGQWHLTQKFVNRLDTKYSRDQWFAYLVTNSLMSKLANDGINSYFGFLDQVSDKEILHYQSTPWLAHKHNENVGNYYIYWITTDGLLYDSQENPMWRPYHGECWESYYYLDKVEKELKENKKVKNVTIENVPYYNVEIEGKKCLHYEYHPTLEEFKNSFTELPPIYPYGKTPLHDWIGLNQKLGLEEYRKNYE